MRFAGTGMLIIGALVGGAAIITENAASAVMALIAGGFIFLAGAVFAVGAGIQDAIKRNR